MADEFTLLKANVVARAVYLATLSTCRSQRGAVIFTPYDGNIVVEGFNMKPPPHTCSRSDACKATCRLEAVHAEIMALMFLRCADARGLDLLHVKAVEGQLVVSGPPSCVDCSKTILLRGIANVWLFHADGWKCYPAREFHQLSLENDKALQALRLAHETSRLGEATGASPWA